MKAGVVSLWLGAGALLIALALILGLAAWSAGGRHQRAGVVGAVLGGCALGFQLLVVVLGAWALQVTVSLLGLLVLAVVVTLLLGLLGG